MASCTPPAISVRDYFRSRPRRRRKQATTGTWWECFKGSRGCGVHHKTQGIAYKHAIKLDRADRRKGLKASWTPRKVTR